MNELIGKVIKLTKIEDGYVMVYFTDNSYVKYHGYTVSVNCGQRYEDHIIMIYYNSDRKEETRLESR